MTEAHSHFAQTRLTSVYMFVLSRRTMAGVFTRFQHRNNRWCRSATKYIGAGLSGHRLPRFDDLPRLWPTSASMSDGVMVHRTHRPDEVCRYCASYILVLLQYAHDARCRCGYLLSALFGYAHRSGCGILPTLQEVLNFRECVRPGLVPGCQPIRYFRDRWLFEQGLRRVDRVVVQNIGQQQNCRTNYGRESTLIPSCYELPLSVASDTRDCVLWVASMRERDYKRPELFS